MSKTFRTILLIGILQSFACLEQKNTDASEIEHKVNILLAKMTLDEKIGQMTQAR
ncbi:MAG: hypothetical protein ACJAXV_001626, partial [Bacteroidia bacterium]